MDIIEDQPRKRIWYWVATTVSILIVVALVVWFIKDMQTDKPPKDSVATAKNTEDSSKTVSADTTSTSSTNASTTITADTSSTTSTKDTAVKKEDPCPPQKKAEVSKPKTTKKSTESKSSNKSQKIKSIPYPYGPPTQLFTATVQPRIHLHKRTIPKHGKIVTETLKTTGPCPLGCGL